MAKRVRLLLLAGAVACVGVITYKVVELLLVQRANDLQRNPLKVLNYVPEAALQLKEFRHAIVKNGRKVWEVMGQEARYFKDEKRALVKQPHIVFHHSADSSSEGTANEGKIYFTDEDVDKVELQGQIRFNYQGLALATDEMFYLAGQGQVVAPGKVTLEGKGLELEGGEMEIDLAEEKVWFRGRVRTRIEPKKIGEIGKVRP